MFQSYAPVGCACNILGRRPNMGNGHLCIHAKSKSGQLVHIKLYQTGNDISSIRRYCCLRQLNTKLIPQCSPIPMSCGVLPCGLGMRLLSMISQSSWIYRSTRFTHAHQFLSTGPGGWWCWGAVPCVSWSPVPSQDRPCPRVLHWLHTSTEEVNNRSVR